MNLHFFIRHDLVAMKWSEGVPQPQVLQVLIFSHNPRLHLNVFCFRNSEKKTSRGLDLYPKCPDSECPGNGGTVELVPKGWFFVEWNMGGFMFRKLQTLPLQETRHMARLDGKIHHSFNIGLLDFEWLVFPIESMLVLRVKKTDIFAMNQGTIQLQWNRKMSSFPSAVIFFGRQHELESHVNLWVLVFLSSSDRKMQPDLSILWLVL